MSVFAAIRLCQRKVETLRDCARCPRKHLLPKLIITLQKRSLGLLPEITKQHQTLQYELSIIRCLPQRHAKLYAICKYTFFPQVTIWVSQSERPLFP